MAVSAVQLSKVHFSTDVTDAGMVMAVSELQQLKALCPIVFRLSGRVMSVSEVHL